MNNGSNNFNVKEHNSKQLDPNSNNRGSNIENNKVLRLLAEGLKDKSIWQSWTEFFKERLYGPDLEKLLQELKVELTPQELTEIGIGRREEQLQELKVQKLQKMKEIKELKELVQELQKEIEQQLKGIEEIEEIAAKEIKELKEIKKLERQLKELEVKKLGVKKLGVKKPEVKNTLPQKKLKLL